MCGIAGILNIADREPKTFAIQSMTDRLAHRGPDAQGIYTDQFIALGHRRLAIIDLHEESNQPMWDHTGRYAIVYNGEIYNYNEIKNELKQYPFTTASDSEVILAAYYHWGADCLSRLNGMFALAIWDSAERILFIARDRLGKKPFYYSFSDQHFIFASEIRSILASGMVPKELEPAYLSEYFTYQAAMIDCTPVKALKQLKAGHYAILKGNSFTMLPFWTYDTITPSDDDHVSAKRKIKELLLDSVRLRMISDVPLGAFLSGGIDSSLIVACMAELSDRPVETFTISFNEAEFDESDFARQVALKYKTSHHRILLRPEVFLEEMEDILSAIDTPSGDGPNTYVVAKHTRMAGIKVALSGLGGDELFAGYTKFLLYHRLVKNRWVLRIPFGLRNIFSAKVLLKLPFNKTTKAGLLLALKDWDMPSLYPVLRGDYSPHEVRQLLTDIPTPSAMAYHLMLINNSTSHLDILSKCTIGEIETYTRDVLLKDTDQMAMAHALEVRAPFFDYRLVEYVLSLSDTVKYPHTPKKLLVDAMAPRLPSTISQRKKMGFTLPWDQWLRNELSPMVENKIKYLADRKEFNGHVVKKKWADYKRGNRGIIWPRIWKIVVLSDWLQRNDL